MAKHKSYNPERRAWRGKSYKKGGKIKSKRADDAYKQIGGLIDDVLAGRISMKESERRSTEIIKKVPSKERIK